MNKKTLIATVIVSLLLISTLFNVQPVFSQPQLGQITISANGSVTGTDKIHQSGNTYTLRGNLSGSIIIDKDNMVFNGAGFTLQGSGNITQNETAISFANRTNDIIENLTITGFNIDIALYNSSKCTISGNKIIGNNSIGIDLNNSWNNWIKQNDVETTQNFGVYLFYSSSNLVSDNRVINNFGTGIGVQSYGAEESYNYELNYFESNNSESNNVISGNILENNEDGIGIESSNNTIIANNIAHSPDTGIALGYGFENIITENNISNCRLAVYFYGDNNTFFENNIVGNDVVVLCHGIELDDTFYYNNFINNGAIDTNGAFDDNPSSPSWDNGTQGNYWGDYLTEYPTAQEVDSTGTYDTPYTITEQTDYVSPSTYLFYDNHPLVNQVEISQNVTKLPFWTPAFTPTNQATPTLYIVTPVVSAVILALILARIIFKRNPSKKPEKT